MIVNVGNYEVTIDEEFYPIFIQYKWRILRQDGYNYIHCHYIQKDRRDVGIRLHRLVLGATVVVGGMVYNDATIVDHIDRNTLNNIKSNLRFCTKSQNAMNCKRRTDNVSGYRGVVWSKTKHKWRAYLSINKKQIHIGYFAQLEDAVNARKRIAQSLYQEFCAE